MLWGLILLSSLLAVHARTVADNQGQEVLLDSVCDVCEENIMPIRGDAIRDFVPTCNMRVGYTTDNNGCKQAIVFCTGNYISTVVAEQINETGHSLTQVVITIGDIEKLERNVSDLVETSVSISCLKEYNGWRTLKVSCETMREVAYPPLCPGEKTVPKSLIRSPLRSSSMANKGHNEPTITQSKSLCGKCGPLTLPPPDSRYSISKTSKGQASCNVQVKYSTDANGCDQATLICTGRRSALAFKNLETAPTVGRTNGATGLASASIVVPCRQGEWQLSSYFCMVQEEVENAIPCPRQEKPEDGSLRSVPEIDDSVNPGSLQLKNAAGAPMN